MKRGRIIFLLIISVLFVLGWSYPAGLEKQMLISFLQGIQEDSRKDAPVVNELNVSDFLIEGKTDSEGEIRVTRAGIPYLSGIADQNGDFMIRMPLQQPGTVLEVYSINKNGAKSAGTKIELSAKELPDKVLLEVPHISQLPELERGCEVTSLAMLLNHAGAKAEKMKLAEEIGKDPTVKIKKDGKIHFGNPEFGFVGNMYTYDEPGFGVFDIPIKELGEKYLPGRMINLTGKGFKEVLRYVAAGHPVWVVTTSTFGHVPEHLWEVWETAHGPIRVTMKMHAVLVTGFDDDYIYVNDPLESQPAKKIQRESFIDGWTQYGQRAVSYF